MQIKPAVPKSWRKFKFAKFSRELLMTTIATTISIILTFGTAHVLEVRQKKAEGKQMVMMVIHDIDNEEESFRKMAKEEELSFMCAQLALQNVDNLAKMNTDTISTVMRYIVSSENVLHYLDDSNERIFLSSQDTWKTIDNAAFVDCVQDFYSWRRMTYDKMNNNSYWVKPVLQTEFMEYQMGSYKIDYTSFLSQRLSEKKVLDYLDLSPSRQFFYNECVDYCKRMSQKCKFMMGITDEEMTEYVAQHSRAGQRMEESDLIGKWVELSNADVYQGYEFFKDHKFKNITRQHLMNSIYSGRVDFIYEVSGSWQLQKDSLVLKVNPNISYKVDDSHITYKPELRDSVKAMVNYWNMTIKERVEQFKKNVTRAAYFASINNVGNRIQLISSEENKQEGNNENYLTREE